ncbi:phosphoadenosine phosphosulfate reductase domain-containing protein [Leeuwenhoekiella nanhaiensis]|uniref:Phosphoadenosine phosphosulfate reductase n=1 Tax=Leeuwenhoekiella nanhaiensis TaxID=1655491 RepID=A0A2G1VM70_9FLAO|nr:phosphoadenosine phosphosulfate reductase family protein [Leeuwenhoekiella nanhaiensis]PHQ27866.1 phosphoadenosine phosphosulfate reductase [Leeuwenhoekiella nanhaiensis]
MKDQLNIFGTEKISVAESIELTIASMIEYGSRHKHWAAAWSWGKDSTTVVTLITQLITTGQIPKPETFTIFAADTRMELPPLWLSAQVLTKQLEERGVKVNVVTAPMDDRFLVYILGRGVPPPSNTFRWCTGQIKVEPMEAALSQFQQEKSEKILMLTGVRLGESSIRDQRINVSCSKDGAECGQGWYQTGLQNDLCATLAPILHWRVCNVWDWLKVFAPMPKYGGWDTSILADAYGGEEAEELNARTGCIGCPLASKDKALDYLINIPDWSYLQPLKRLKPIYREMKKPQYRLRKAGGQRKKDGTLAKNQQRMGPLTLSARLKFFYEIIDIQNEINEQAVNIGKPKIFLINSAEGKRIKELIAAKTYPNGWDGTEPKASKPLDKIYSDGSVMKRLFY